MSSEETELTSLVSEPALNLILETALDPVIVMRLDGTIAAWSVRAQEVFGWSFDEVLNQNMAELIIPDRHRADHYRGLQHYLLTGYGPLLRKRVETTARRRNGEEFPVELSISPLSHSGTQFFVGFLRDVSKRHQTQRLLEHQARHATLLHQVTSLAAETSSVDAILQLCLDAVCELTGWPVGHAYVPAEGPAAKLIPTTIWHLRGSRYEQLRQISEAMHFEPGVGLPGHIWKTSEPHWIADVTRADANFPRFRQQPDLGIRAAFGIPIKSGNAVIAVLEFFNDAVTEYDPQVLLTARTFGDQVGRVLERREVQERDKLLLAELNHRVKNMLTVVIGIANHTARTATSTDQFRQGFIARLTSLGRSYNLLTQWENALIKAILEEIVRPHIPHTHQLMISGPDLGLSPKAALALSMVFHELITNAVKYGALSVPHGTIAVNWTVTQEEAIGSAVELVWREGGLKNLQPPQEKTGFGSKLIQMSIKHELGGQVDTTYEPDGIHYKFRFRGHS